MGELVATRRRLWDMDGIWKARRQQHLVQACFLLVPGQNVPHSFYHRKNILHLHISNMEPIPLRTLTLLLNYERAVSDPRFVGMRLLESTEADPSLPRRLVKSEDTGRYFKGGPDTIEYVSSFLKFLSIHGVSFRVCSVLS